MNKPLKVFITYSHKNRKEKNKLITYLDVMRQESLIDIWHDNKILAGDTWKKEIFSTNLPELDLLLYLVSADSLASENCNKELVEALKADIRVIPIILERCDWLNHQLSDLVVLPDKGMPITEWVPESKGWRSVVEGIRKTIDKMQSQADPSSGASDKEQCADLAVQHGSLLMVLGQIDRAIEAYSRALELNPRDAEAYNNRGIAYHRKREVDQAIEDYSKVMELNPGLAIAYNNRGVAHNSKGKVDGAIEDYNIAIGLNPDFVDAYYNRGEVWLRRREWEKAKADLITAKSRGVDIVAAFRNDYKNIAAFERANQVKLPEDIAALVRQGFRNRYPRKGKVLSADGEPFEFPEVLELRETLRDAGTPLGEYVKVQPYFGVNTAPTEVFVVDGNTRDKLIAEHPSSEDILKPFLHGRNIRRWQVEPPEQWLIFAYRGIEIDAYPAIWKYLEKRQESLSKRKGKGEWYELRASVKEVERYAGPKLVCPNLYNTQTFAIETEGFFCGSSCCIIPTAEKWLCGLLNTRTVEWLYSQISDQLGPGELQARSGFMKQIPVPNLSATQKDLVRKIVDYLIYLQNQPTTNSKDLAHARDFLMLKYFERIINGLVYEFYMPDVLQSGNRDLFKHLMAEQLLEVKEFRGDKMSAFRALYERMHHKEHPVRVNLFFQDSLRPIRIIEDKW